MNRWSTGAWPADDCMDDLHTMHLEATPNRAGISRAASLGSTLGHRVSKSACFTRARVNGKRKSSRVLFAERAEPLLSFATRCNPRDSEPIRSKLSFGLSVPMGRNPLDS